MTRLLIAEKPSVARDIARVLGASRRGDGYLEGSGWIISWCIGHLVELIEPHEYDPEWKRWSLGSLPMLPAEFRLRPVQSTSSQFNVVKQLLHRRDLEEVVNGCDAGREGELIFRYVYQLSGATTPISRLWISSMTDQAIQEGLARLRPAREYERLFAAARCRSEADWLVGLNATRAITVRSRQGQAFDKNAPLYSVGRVQTPTLALIVDRELEITDFKPKDYWQLVATFDSPKGSYQGRWFRKGGPGSPLEVPGEPGSQARADGTIDRLDTEAEAVALRDKVLDRDGLVIELEQKRTKEPPPMLFDLTRLQRTANKRFGFSAAHTLEVAQALYERHKILTYPRTDSTHLGSDLVPKLKDAINAVRTGPYTPFADRLLALEKLPTSKRFIDDKKVSDHHAIIPTPTRPRLESLNLDERKIYDLVVRRFLGVFFPDAVFDRTRVVTGVEGETFLTRGKVMVDPGWREVAGFKDDEPKKKAAEKVEKDGDDGEGDDEEDQGALPPLKKGDPAHVREIDLQTKQTQPPPRFTEASLLAAMEGAGKLIDEEELQQAMKDTGLGTPATRASIIETLIHRQYIYRKGKALMPTEKGIRLIRAIPVESLRSPQLTGEWEARLARMARGDYPSDRFMDEVRGYVQELVGRIKRARPIETVAAEMLPVSDGGNEEKGGDKGKTGAAEGKRARGDGASRGKASPAEGASGGKKARGQEKGGKADGARPGDPPGTLGRCPRCQGPVLERPEAWACVAGGRGCGFAVRRKMAGKELTDSMVKKLLEKGRTQVLKGFVSPRSGVKFDAALFLKPEGGVGFEFQNQPEKESAPASAPSKRPVPVPAAASAPSPRPVPVPATASAPSPRPVPVPATASAPSPRPVPVPAPVAPESSAPGSLGGCPLCSQGQLIAGHRAWGCSRWKDGCRFVIPFQIAGISISEPQARRLLSGSRVGPLRGLQAQDGSRFDGELVLELDYPANKGGVRVVRLEGASG